MKKKKFTLNMTRRQVLKAGMIGGAGLLLPWKFKLPKAYAQIPGGTLAPGSVEKYVMPLVKPPAMPGEFLTDSYDYSLAVRQFTQPILPNATVPIPGNEASNTHPSTTVWSYGPTDDPRTVFEGGSYFYPAFTVENRWNMRTNVQWHNKLYDNMGNFYPHITPIDPTLHWANPIGARDRRPPADPNDPYWDSKYIDNDGRYVGPVPMITHVHGAHTYEWSDGYPEAWYLPNCRSVRRALRSGDLTYGTGTFFDYYVSKMQRGSGLGHVRFAYPNDQPATTLWYHDHTLGMTRNNVYAGPAGYWLIRGGPNDMDLGYVAPGVGANPFGEYTEIPIVIQDRSFNDDGSLFYPDNRAFFEGLNPGQLQIPFIPDGACGGPSDVSPIWNPEFFGNMMVVNGFTWPYLEVEQRRYRFRFLNGCNSRFLILKADNNMPFYQIGAEQGFLPETVELNQLLMGPAERADVIMDFTNVARRTEIILQNLGPDEPFGGGIPGVDFDPSDAASTGQVMQFRVKAATSPDTSILPNLLPAAPALGPVDNTRAVSLNEEESGSVRVSEENGNIVLDCDNEEPFGPTAALLGTLSGGTGNPLLWMDAITENPALNDTEIWEIHNFTVDAHPIHVHLVHFEVVNREDGDGTVRDPEPWETGPKDTVIAYPGEITRIKMKFDLAGFYVWHCHIVEHEDNEMMRPYHVGPIPPDAPQQ